MDPREGESVRGRELRESEGDRSASDSRSIDILPFSRGAPPAHSSSRACGIFPAVPFSTLARQVQAQYLLSSYSGVDGPSAEEIRRIERERQHRRRSTETSSQREARLAARRQQYAARRREQIDQQRVEAQPSPDHDLRRAIIPLDCAVFSYDPEIDYSAHPMIDIGKLERVCRLCSARRFKAEADGICCAKGKVRIQPIEQPPEPILTLQGVPKKQLWTFSLISHDCNRIF